MKRILLVVSIIYIVLGCLPCSDVKAGLAAGNYVSASTENGKHSEKSDFCNPYCACSCCGVNHMTPVITTVKLDINAPARTYNSRYQHQAVSSMAIPVWQPPQLLS